MNPSLGLLSIFIMFHHSQQEPDKQPQEMPWKVWRTKINAQTVVRGAELGQANLGWKTSKLFSFKITLVPREAETPSRRIGAARICEKGEGQVWTTPASTCPDSCNPSVTLNSFFLSLFASSFPSTSQPSLHLDAPKIVSEILFSPNFSRLRAGLGSRCGARWLCSNVTQRRPGFSLLLHYRVSVEPWADGHDTSPFGAPLPSHGDGSTISLSTSSPHLLKFCRLK